MYLCFASVYSGGGGVCSFVIFSSSKYNVKANFSPLFLTKPFKVDGNMENSNLTTRVH